VPRDLGWASYMLFSCVIACFLSPITMVDLRSFCVFCVFSVALFDAIRRVAGIVEKFDVENVPGSTAPAKIRIRKLNCSMESL